MSRALRAVLLLLPTACAGGARTVHLELFPARPDASRPALEAAAETFYTATTAPQLRAAVAAAERADADSPLAHELAAALAHLEAREPDAFEHLFAALRQPKDDAALLHLDALLQLSSTQAQRARVRGLLEALLRSHPSDEVRAQAAYRLAGRLHQEGYWAARDEALAATGWRPRFAVVGAWDNEQGKGFDDAFGPETAIDLAQRFEGAILPIGWRMDPPVGPFGGELNLGALINPDVWSVAYAATAFRSAAGGKHELRIGTTDPIRIWVNGLEVFSLKSSVSSYELDQLVVPVVLRAGVNRVLVKSPHETGAWQVLLRITGPGGAPAMGLSHERPDAPVAEGAAPVAKAVTLEDVVTSRLEGLPGSTARRAYHELAWARVVGAGQYALKLGGLFVAKYPDAIAGAELHATNAWDNAQRGKASDVLARLDKTAGDELLYVRLQVARLQQQDGLTKKARTVLLKAREAHADNPLVWTRVADLFAAEGWDEDRCLAQREVQKLRPGMIGTQLERVGCARRLGRLLEAEEILAELRSELPYNLGALDRSYEIALELEDLSRAEALARMVQRAFPNATNGWMKLAEVSRRRGDRAGAEAALVSAGKIAPDWKGSYRELGRLAYLDGDTRLAVERWRAALARDPKDEKLAHRLAYLAPAADSAWEADVPDEGVLEEASRAKERKPMAGADVVYELDDEVTHVNVDGSTNNVITLVARAVNEAGRDRLTRIDMQRGGRTRVLHAYALLGGGRKIESSTREGAIHFCGLETGARVVLQYRLDTSPVHYLAKHVSQRWAFQGAATETVKSRLVVFAPAGTKFHESMVGAVIRDERKVGGESRISFSATDTPPIIPEPNMPPAHELAIHVTLSNVPSWDDYVRWEDALLEDAFAEGPEVRQVVEKILAGSTDKLEQLTRIHEYVMENVRYQQDYENPIAGVKPHPAPVVIERKYGDCKDKAVLFITLARAAGLEARYALVRTRNVGPLVREVPMQQFNHVIVYAPEQPGLAEGRYFDPTADALDLDVLRSDDPGTDSLVYDPKSKHHEWRNIPFQTPEHQSERVRLHVDLAADGSAKGELVLEERGQTGSKLRQIARNEKQLAQAFQLIVPVYYAGSTPAGTPEGDTRDLRKPARFRVGFSNPSLARKEGDTLRVKIPASSTPERAFSLEKRRFPLVLGAPSRALVELELAVPEGYRVARLPKETEIPSECVHFSRKAAVDGKTVRTAIEVRYTCERIPPDAYPTYRKLGEAIRQALEEELVLEPETAKPAKAGRGGKPPR